MRERYINCFSLPSLLCTFIHTDTHISLLSDRHTKANFLAYATAGYRDVFQDSS